MIDIRELRGDADGFLAKLARKGAADSGRDIEAWFPGQRRYREITSTSNTTDDQSRRLDIRFRRDGKLEYVHTLNSTAIPARAMLAILENFQNADGSISVPEALWEFGVPRRLSVPRRSIDHASQ
jgi:seryl-tRNA synthetase